jgi:hypothetical protein
VSEPPFEELLDRVADLAVSVQAAEDRFEVGEGQHSDSVVEGAARRVADERGDGRPDAGDRAHAAGYLLDVDASVVGLNRSPF